jgi:fucose permease
MNQPFARDRLTWLGYLLVGNYCYTMAALGPLMPFLRSELQLSYTIAAYHFSAWALGSLFAGTFGDRVVSALGRSRTIVFMGTSYLVGVTIIIVGHSAPFTIFGALVCGFNASILGQTIMALLADRFGAQRAIAITEMNICASICAVLAPFAVSLCVKFGMGWRAALIFPIAAFIFLALAGRGQLQGLPPPMRKTGTRARLPLAYWAYWFVIQLMVACEWSLIFWSAEFVEHVCKFMRADAAQCVSIFLSAMLIGRIVGSRLVRRFKSSVMLPVASVVAISGFGVFWLGQLPVANLAGLFVAGLGIANFYPLTVASALGVVPEQSATAAARFSIASGSAVLLAPLLLGMAADRYGIFNAYGIVAVLLVIAAGMVLLANWSAHLHALQQQEVSDSKGSQAVPMPGTSEG